MNATRTVRQRIPALCLFSLLGAGLLSSPAQAGLVTDSIATTNAVATNYFLGVVGVGTTNPTYTLDVTGNLRVTGTGTFAAVTGNGSGLTGIGSSALAAGSIGSAQLATGAVGSAQLAVNAVQANNIVAGAVTTNKLDLANLDQRYVSPNNPVLLNARTNVPTLQQVTAAGGNTTNAVTFGGAPVFMPGEIAHYKMNDNTTNTIVIDVLGGYNGMSYRNTSLMTTTGIIGGALCFDGVSDYMKLAPETALTNYSVFSFSCWWKPATTIHPGDRDTALFSDPHVCAMIAWDDIGSGLTIGCNNGYWNSASWGGTLFSNNWYFIAGTWGSHGMNLYVNGSLVASSPTVYTQWWSDTVDKTNLFIVGGEKWRGAGYQWAGTMDEVRFHSVELTPVQVAVIYNGGNGNDTEGTTPGGSAQFDSYGNLTFISPATIKGVTFATAQ